MRGEAECRAHDEAECRCTPFCTQQNRPLLFPSPFGCHQLAPEGLAQRRFTAWSGRRGSNPRQPAWKAGGCVIAVRSVYIGLTAGFIRFVYNVSATSKRCHARFLCFSAKHVTYFCRRYVAKNVARNLRQEVTLLRYTIPDLLIFGNNL